MSTRAATSSVSAAVSSWVRYPGFGIRGARICSHRCSAGTATISDRGTYVVGVNRTAVNSTPRQGAAIFSRSTACSTSKPSGRSTTPSLVTTPIS
ncbi:hypothetical protein G419_21834 [Rhodococcus triatomae BKS 15-14]|nr:hypothetical protein G419_21834 [Rhodococcus triatomae BKS 15-14]